MGEQSNEAGRLSNRDVLFIAKVAIKRWGELVTEEIERDLATFPNLDAFSEAYLAAYWHHVVGQIMRW